MMKNTKKTLSFLLALALCLSLLCGCIPAETPQVKATEPATEPIQPVIVEPQPSEAEILAWTELTEGLTISARTYFVYDTKTSSFLASSAPAETKVFPASVTKLMTALVALEYLQPTEYVTAGREMEKISWDSSVAGIKKGDTLTVSQLIEGMMLPSGNDAAYVIAAAAGRKILKQDGADAFTAVDAFIARMNGKAQELGLYDSHFVNPDGMHSDNHYLSIRDLAKLGQLATENATIAKYTGLAVGNNPKYDEKNTDENAPRQWMNTNALLHPESVYYCSYAIGLKTGSTNAAGKCLLSAFLLEGKTYIVGVFGCPEDTMRFTDTLMLFLDYIVNEPA